MSNKPEVTNWDLKNIAASFASIPFEGGAGTDGFLTIERETPAFAFRKGVDGSVVRYKTNDKMTKCTLHLQTTSSLVPVLCQLVSADEDSPNGSGIGTFSVKKLDGPQSLTDDQAWCEGPPASVALDAEPKDVQFIFWCPLPKRQNF